MHRTLSRFKRTVLFLLIYKANAIALRNLSRHSDGTVLTKYSGHPCRNNEDNIYTDYSERSALLFESPSSGERRKVGLGSDVNDAGLNKETDPISTSSNSKLSKKSLRSRTATTQAYQRKIDNAKPEESLTSGEIDAGTTGATATIVGRDRSSVESPLGFSEAPRILALTTPRVRGNMKKNIRIHFAGIAETEKYSKNPSERGEQLKSSKIVGGRNKRDVENDRSEEDMDIEPAINIHITGVPRRMKALVNLEGEVDGKNESRRNYNEDRLSLLEVSPTLRKLQEGTTDDQGKVIFSKGKELNSSQINFLISNSNDRLISIVNTLTNLETQLQRIETKLSTLDHKLDQEKIQELQPTDSNFNPPIPRTTGSSLGKHIPRNVFVSGKEIEEINKASSMSRMTLRRLILPLENLRKEDASPALFTPFLFLATSERVDG